MMHTVKIAHGADVEMPRRAIWMLAVICVAVILLLAPHILRELSGKEELIGYEAYLHARIADRGYSLSPWQDRIVATPRMVQPTPYHLALGLFQDVFGVRAASIALPLVVGLACVGFLSWILALFKRPALESAVTLLAFMLSPVFLFIGSTTTPHGLALALILLGTALFLTRHVWILSLAPWGLLVFFDLFHVLVVIALMLAWILIDKNERTRALAAGGILAVGVFLARPPFFTPYSPIARTPIFGTITDFGGHVGFGVFLLILVCIGMVYSWKRKRTYVPAYFLVGLGVLAMASFGGIVSIYLMPLAAIFIATALLELRSRQWSIPMLRSLTFALIICGLLFSLVSYMGRLAEAGPDEGLIEASSFLREISSPDDVILTHPTYAPVVEIVAGRPVVLDSFQQDPWIKQDMGDLFASRNSAQIIGTLRKYAVSYLLIDRTIDEEDVWTGSNDGLLFVLRDGETFKKVYGTDSLEVWKVLR